MQARVEKQDEADSKFAELKESYQQHVVGLSGSKTDVIVGGLSTPEKYYPLSIVHTNSGFPGEHPYPEAHLSEQLVHSNTVITGDAGAGKSTLLKRLAVQSASKFDWVFYIPMSRLTKDRYPATGNYTAADIIVNECFPASLINQMKSAFVTELKAYINNQLSQKTNSMLVMLDGYDGEVLSSHLAEAVEGLLDAESLVLSMQSERLTYNHRVHGLETFTAYHVNGFSHEVAKQYVNDCYNGEQEYNQARYSRMALNTLQHSSRDDQYYNPATCQVAAYIAKHGGMPVVNNGESAYKTQMLSSLLLDRQTWYLLHRDHDPISSYRVNSFTQIDLLEHTLKESMAIERLAYQDLVSDFNLYPTCEQDKKAAMPLGFIDNAETSTIQFTYQPIRDYLAARFLVNCMFGDRYLKEYRHQVIVPAQLAEKGVNDIKTFLQYKCADPSFYSVGRFMLGMLARNLENQSFKDYMNLIQSSPFIESAEKLRLVIDYVGEFKPFFDKHYDDDDVVSLFKPRNNDKEAQPSLATNQAALFHHRDDESSEVDDSLMNQLADGCVVQ